MVNDVAPTVPAIGACLRCNQLFLVTDTVTNCLVCGHPPDVTLPFGRDVPAGEHVEFAPPGFPHEVVQIPSIVTTCPNCEAVLEFRTAGLEVDVIPPAPLLPADEAGPVDQPSSEPASQPVQDGSPCVCGNTKECETCGVCTTCYPHYHSSTSDPEDEGIRPGSSEHDVTHTEEPPA